MVLGLDVCQEDIEILISLCSPQMFPLGLIYLSSFLPFLKTSGLGSAIFWIPEVAGDEGRQSRRDPMNKTISILVTVVIVFSQLVLGIPLLSSRLVQWFSR